jgi:hypothetical protein
VQGRQQIIIASIPLTIDTVQGFNLHDQPRCSRNFSGLHVYGFRTAVFAY